MNSKNIKSQRELYYEKRKNSIPGTAGAMAKYIKKMRAKLTELEDTVEMQNQKNRSARKNNHGIKERRTYLIWQLYLWGL